MESDSGPNFSSSDEEIHELLMEDAKLDTKNKELLKKGTQKTQEKQINYRNASIFSRIFFNWSKLAMRISNSGLLKTSDVCALAKTQSTRYKISNLQKYYNKYTEENRKYPLVQSIFVVHMRIIFYLFFLDSVSIILEYTGIFFFGKILNIFTNGEFFPKRNNFFDIFKGFKFKFNIIECVSAYVLIKYLRSVTLNHLDFNNIILVEKITNETTSLLFEKIIKGSTITNHLTKGEGEKLNLIEVDAEEIGSLFFSGPKVVIFPIKIIFSMILLFRIFGNRFIYTILALIIVTIIILFLQVLYVKNLKILLEQKDKRMKIITYVFQMLKNIKLNGWDNEFINRIKVKRDNELIYTKKNLNVEITRFLLSSNINLIIMVISLGLYITSSNKEFTVSNLFTSFQIINSMTFPIMIIPLFINQIFKNIISIERLQHFLYSEDHKQNIYQNKYEFDTNKLLIKFDKVTFGIKEEEKYQLSENLNNSQNNSNKNISQELQKIDTKMELLNSDSSENDIHTLSSRTNGLKNIDKNNLILLKDISFSIKKNEFIAILGPTGAGKSCLINAILNNYHIYSQKSNIIINGELSYDSQQSWVMTDTIRNNILFYNKYDENKYRQVVSVCQLENDFDQFAKGDKTEINSTSVNVSGGQKARIALARCLYKDADLYLLDDPLSSIDSRVGNKIFKEAFCSYLCDKARILVTNELNNLNNVDKIVYMEKGKIIFTGSFKEFNEKYGAKNMEIEEDENENLNYDEQSKKVRRYLRRRSSANSSNCEEYLQNIVESEQNKNIKKIENNPLNKTRKKSVSCKTYLSYIEIQGGFCILFILVIFIIAVEFIESYRRVFATSMGKDSKNNLSEKENKKILTNNFFQYAKISICGIILNFIVEFIITRTTIHSLRTLHEIMIEKLVRAPINLFHDIVPIGQILNRITKDIELIQGIIKIVNYSIKTFLSMGATIIVCYMYNKIILYSAPFLFISCILVTKYYVNAQRNLVRLHRISYSPILTISSESIRGVDIIRTAHVEEDCRNKIYKRLDDHFGVHIYIEGSRGWYNLTLRIFSSTFLGFILFYMAIYSKYFNIQAMAIILQCLEDLSEKLLNSVRFYSELELCMIGLERCEQVRKINTEKEPPTNCDKTNELKLKNWPEKGKINFINYFAKYRPDTPDVLKRINLEILPGDKVAIVGRTGSGKSSLILAIARIIEAKSGQILIDDVDLKNVNLDFLRQSISIVPQEPFIIEGNLRENIDPLMQHSDKEIINILNDFCLLDELDENERLNFKIIEGGKNLSSGQRQLICFARAIIKNNKIIILDEATSSLDVETEKIIQKNMEKYFKESTVLMITHHIRIVKNFKKVIVIENGRVVETGTRDDLMKDKRSRFFSLYEESLGY